MSAMTHVMLLPRNACIGILKAYRTVISPLYGDVCRYYPSCSAYALEAITVHGVAKGVGLGTLRIARCHPWAAGGVDDVPTHSRKVHRTNRFGFVTGIAPHEAQAQAHSHGAGCDHPAPPADSPVLHLEHQRKV
jgi:putative membrane protein insertion efficiency factor